MQLVDSCSVMRFYKQVKGVEIVFGKIESIIWRLLYWRDLQVMHSLDVMHIKKNVCNAILGTLMNIPGKTKNVKPCEITLNVRVFVRSCGHKLW